MSGYFKRMVQLARHGPVSPRTGRTGFVLPRPVMPNAGAVVGTDRVSGDGEIHAALTDTAAAPLPRRQDITESSVPVDAPNDSPLSAETVEVTSTEDPVTIPRDQASPVERVTGRTGTQTVETRHAAARRPASVPPGALARSSTTTPVMPAPMPVDPPQTIKMPAEIPEAAKRPDQPEPVGAAPVRARVDAPPHIVRPAAPLPPEAAPLHLEADQGRTGTAPSPVPRAEVVPSFHTPSSPIAQPAVEVNIGAISLELTPEAQPPPAAPASRPAPARPRNGVWSGTRDLTRNYVRRG